MNFGVYVKTWHVGGVAAFCERLAAGLQERGHVVCLVLGTPHGKRDVAGRSAYNHLRANAHFRVHCLHLSAFHPKERAWSAANFVNAQSFDAVFLSAHHSIRDALPLMAGHTARFGLAHTDDPDSYDEFLATGAACDGYVGVSAAITETLVAMRKGSSPALIREIPYGVPAPPVASGAVSGAPRVLTVCRLVQRQKRVLDLPLVWKKYLALGGKGTLTICGPGEEETSLRAAFAEELSRGTVRLLGAVALSQMAEVYATHDVLLSVSAYEGLPIVVLEAASAGLFPLLSRTRSGHPEIVQALGQGKLCAIGDTDGFAAALKEVTSDIESIRGLRLELRERAQARYGLSQMIEAYERLALETVLQCLRQGQAEMPKPPRVDFLRRWLRRWQYQRHYGKLGRSVTWPAPQDSSRRAGE